MKRLQTFVLVLISAFPTAWASADPRPFTFTSDAYPAGQGNLEYEQWVTFSTRTEEDHGLSRFLFRQEFEYGLTDHFDLSIYVASFSYENSDERDGLHYDSSALEAIYYFTSPVTDPVGLALYTEVALGEHELEIENKLIVQKDVGKWTFAYNLVLETEIEHLFDGDSNNVEGVIGHTLGVCYAFAPAWRFGGEAFVQSEYAEWSDYEETLAYAGPVLSYQGGNFGKSDVLWWTTVTPAYQLSHVDDAADFQVRMIFGVEF
jgi:hypothetical protein